MSRRFQAHPMSDRRCTYRPNGVPCLQLSDAPIHVRDDERMRPGAHVWRHDFDFEEQVTVRRVAATAHEPQVIEGYVDPSGRGEGNWSSEK